MPFLTNAPLPQCLQHSSATRRLLARDHDRGCIRYLLQVKCLNEIDWAGNRFVARTVALNKGVSVGVGGSREKANGKREQYRAHCFSLMSRLLGSLLYAVSS